MRDLIDMFEVVVLISAEFRDGCGRLLLKEKDFGRCEAKFSARCGTKKGLSLGSILLLGVGYGWWKRAKN